MKFAKKNKGKVVHAYELGKNTEMERRLIEAGAIQCLEDGSYRLFSREAVNGIGELAHPGDFFKVDKENDKYYPYPNRRDWFLERHRPLGENEYEQKVQPIPVWTRKDPVSEEIEYLLKTGKLEINQNDKAHFYNALLWGAPLSAADDAVVVFYEINRDSNGEITDISFNFVDRNVFERDYTVCGERI